MDKKVLLIALNSRNAAEVLLLTVVRYDSIQVLILFELWTVLVYIVTLYSLHIYVVLGFMLFTYVIERLLSVHKHRILIV